MSALLNPDFSAGLKMQSVIGIYYLEEHEMESKMPRSVRVLWERSKAHKPVTLTDLIIFL